MRLFNKKDSAKQTDIVQEKWSTSFSIFQEHRFAPVSGDGYSSSIAHGSLELNLERKNIFAWIDDPLYRYDDFYLSASLSFDSSNGYSSTGFLFRRTDDISYYYFLVSNRGYFRLDSVLNGSPSVLIDWTELPDFNHEKFTVTIFAEGSLVNLYLNGSWIGNVSDEGLAAGGISFAGQNYDESDSAVLRLNKFEIESRTGRLDKLFTKLSAGKVTLQARLKFIESRMKSGHYSAALIELNRILKAGDIDKETILLAADCCINLELYAEAEGYLEKLSDSEQDERYIMNMAVILYMTNSFLKLRDFLQKNLSLTETNPAAANLLGNAQFSLGNWEAAASAYRKAFDLDSKQPLYAVNTARALEKIASGTGEVIDEAAEMYGKAANIYFRAGDYDELAGILPFLEKLDNNAVETEILKAKLLFQEGRLDDANRIFLKLIKKKSCDSTVYYLNALIEAGNGKKRKAAASFKKAVEIEPEYYLYHFKQAEFLFLTGGKYRDALENALKLSPDDPWVQNLAGQGAMAENQLDAAVGFFEKAISAAPEEDEIMVNYSEALHKAGRTVEALALLNEESAMQLNQRGNIFSDSGRFEQAVADYEAAYKLDRNNPDVMLNLAAACIESDAFSRAEELLVRVLDLNNSATAYNLMGNLSHLKGEYSRAEAAFKAAVELEPEYEEAVCNLADLYISRERLHDADLLLAGFKGENAGSRFDALKNLVFRKRMDVFSCNSCDEEWIVPKKIDVQPGLRLVGEPADNMPAGKCLGCGKVYCIGCAKNNIKDGRMICADCGEPLKLSENWMRYLYHQSSDIPSVK